MFGFVFFAGGYAFGPRVFSVPFEAEGVELRFALRGYFYGKPSGFVVYLHVSLEPFAEGEAVFGHVRRRHVYVAVLCIVFFGFGVAVFPSLCEGVLPVHAYGVEALYLVLGERLRAFESSVSCFAHSAYPCAYAEAVFRGVMRGDVEAAVFFVVFDAGAVVFLPLVVELVPDHAKFIEHGYAFIGEVISPAAAVFRGAEVGYPRAEFYAVVRDVVGFYIYVAELVFVFAEGVVVLVPCEVVSAAPVHAYCVEFFYSLFCEYSAYFAGADAPLRVEP